MSSSDESDLGKESMAPNPVDIPTLFTQPQLGGFNSLVDQPLSLKDWAESLIEFTETSGYLASSSERQFSPQEFSDAAPPSVQGELLSLYSNVQPTHSQINTVMTCAVVSSYQESDYNTLSGNKVFNELHEYKGVQENNMAKTAASNLSKPLNFLQNNQGDLETISENFHVKFSNKEQEFAAYVPICTTRTSMETSLHISAVHPGLANMPQSHSTSKNFKQPGHILDPATRDIFSHAPSKPASEEGPFSYLKASNIDRDVTELLPSTLPINDIDMLSTYDFDIDADIYVHESTEARNLMVSANTPVSDTYLRQNWIDTNRSSNSFTERTLHNADSQIVSNSDCIYKESSIELNLRPPVADSQGKDTGKPTSTNVGFDQTVLSIPSHSPLITDMGVERLVLADNPSLDVHNKAQSISFISTHRQKHQLIRSSSDPISLLSYNKPAPSASPIFLPKLQHQISLPFDTYHAQHEPWHSQSLQSSSVASSSSSAFTDVRLQSFVKTPSPQGSQSTTSHIDVPSYLNKSPFILQTQQVSPGPINPNPCLLPVTISEPFQGESDRANYLPCQKDFPVKPESMYGTSQSFPTDDHGDELKVWEPEDSTLSFTEELNMDGPSICGRADMINTENTPFTKGFCLSGSLSQTETSYNQMSFLSPPNTTNEYTSLDFLQNLDSFSALSSTTDSPCNSKRIDSSHALMPSQCSTTFSSTSVQSTLHEDHSKSSMLVTSACQTNISTTISSKSNIGVDDRKVFKLPSRLHKHLTESPKASSSKHVTLDSSTKPDNCGVKASLRTKLKGKGKKHSIKTGFSDVVDLEHPEAKTSRRQARKRLPEHNEPNSEKKKPRTKRTSGEAFTSVPESLDKVGSSSSTASDGPGVSACHRAIESKDEPGSTSLEASVAPSTDKRPSDRGTKRTKQALDPVAQREKNRLSARDCRVKKQLKIERLLTEVRRLEEKQARMKTEIEKMSDERDDLQKMLDNHAPNCKMKK
ncbi:jun dimerization protein 2 [Elysia marginata]|uniref:Jun dimerization protein 2 n=1 Tax=Elysia marginata TaxID=1093978 RepID=A0AAV4F6K3_9GAST|nr:jun dimerization protein 2 [Elysia marginata]